MIGFAGSLGEKYQTVKTALTVRTDMGKRALTVRKEMVRMPLKKRKKIDRVIPYGLGLESLFRVGTSFEKKLVKDIKSALTVRIPSTIIWTEKLMNLAMKGLTVGISLNRTLCF